MSREDIEKKIKNLESSQFFLAMKDHWSPNDFSKDNHYTSEIRRLKQELEDMAQKGE